MEALVRSLPVQPPDGSQPADDYLDTPEALLLRLLRNRNFRPRNAQILQVVGDGPYVSDSTVTMLGSGKVTITPQYVTAFAHLLGYPPGDMVALTGIGPVVQGAKVHPANAEIAALAWRARLLSSKQLSQVIETAELYGTPESPLWTPST
ncbi:hypothetical protein ACFWDK_30505 [Micromonospora chalcea]